MSTFGEIGLFLHRDFDYPTYRSTPANSATFASTGGDGVHYGLLFGREMKEADPPVVMTVPMNFDLPNVIVGENLSEFLALGCRTGYFSLEQLVYESAGTILDLQSGDYYSDMPKEEIEMLSLIATEFDLSPWKAPADRLEELRSKYHSKLEMPASDTEAD